MAKVGIPWLLSVAILVGLYPQARVFADDSEAPPPSVPVEELLKGPDRQDFRWKVYVLQTLTVHQRHLVQVAASVRARDLLKGASVRDLHVITKIASSNGTWLEGQSYSHFLPQADFRGGDTLHSFANLYLQPGEYTVAMIAWDSIHNKGNVWRNKLTVFPIGPPLTDVGHSLPMVEFLPAAEPAPILKSAVWSLNKPAALARYMVDTLALGGGSATLPIATGSPVQIDIIVNLADGIEVLEQQQEQTWGYRYNEGLVLQAGNLLAQLSPTNGCVRFSAVDILRQDIFAERVNVSKLDWNSLSKKIAGTDLNKISAKALRARETAIWFKHFVERVSQDNSACASSGANPAHVLIVISRAMLFPNGAQVTPVNSILPQPRCYYLELRFKYGSLNWDEIERVLKPMSPKRLQFTDADSLRARLNFILRDLANRPNQ